MKTCKVISALLLSILFVTLLIAAHPPLRTAYLPTELYQHERADSAHGFDVTKYEITLAINDQTHFISGSVKAFVTATDNISSIEYNLVGLTVSQVKVNNVTAVYTHQNGLININVAAAAGQQFTTEVTYSGVPILSPAPYNIGMAFSTNSVATLSDPDASRYWWPCYDHPWDKAIVDLHITMRSDWLVACNGIRTGITVNVNGTKTHHWLGSNPMATYLASVTAAPFVELNQTSGTTPIQNFVMQSQYNNALIDFASLPTMMQHYETLFGPYPFEKYGNAVVPITTFSAMEHQTMTTLGSYLITGTLFGEPTIAHELAHQWFGNCLTPLTFKDVWLSEGFATYSEALWIHKRDGWQAACNYINTSFRNYYIGWENNNPNQNNIIYNPPFHAYFYPQSYEKAAMVLHMLRLKIGSPNFFQLLQNWFTTYHNSNVITAEFQAMAEQISGQNLNQFFQQWVYSRGLPSVEYTLMQNLQTHQAKIWAKSTCTYPTQFDMEMPFTTNAIANGDSLIFRATAQGFGNVYTMLPAAASFTVNSVDPRNWVLYLAKTQKDVILTQCLPSSQSVFLQWEPFNQIAQFAGYHVYRKMSADPNFTRITTTPLTTTTFWDNGLQNDMLYLYKITAVDNQGFETLGSNFMSAAPVQFTFDWGMLVVDETRDGTGGMLAPTDVMVDDFYTAALSPIAFTHWDLATSGAPSINTLSHFPIVLWHSDDYSQIQLDASLNDLSSYLLGNGILVLSGWKAPSIFSSQFKNLFLPDVTFVYDNASALISAQSGQYSQLLPDPDKLPANWNGMLSMVYTFQDALNPLYTAQMTTTAAGNGLPVVIRDDTHGKLALFGFPLYYMQATGVRAMLQQLLPELYPLISAEDDFIVPSALKMSCYPNPIKGSLTIEFNRKLLPDGKLKIFNTKGQCVSVVGNTALKTGNSITWEAKDTHGKELSSGVYFIRYSDSKNTLSTKVLLLK